MLAPLYTPDTLADFLGVKPQTVRLWHSQGRGPRATYVGKYVRYTAAAIEEWIEANTQQPVPAKRGPGRPRIARPRTEEARA